MAPAWRNFKNIFFTICTWPNRPVVAKILSGFQLEGKTDVWISQVTRVKSDSYEQTKFLLGRNLVVTVTDNQLSPHVIILFGYEPLSQLYVSK